MSNWPLGVWSSGAERSLVDLANSVPIATFSTGVSGAAPTWVEVFAATPYDVDAISLRVHVGHDLAVIDVGVGTAGSEVTVCEDLMHHAANPTLMSYTLPLAIAKGSRLCVAVTTTQATATTALVQVLLHRRSWFMPRGVDKITTVNADRSTGRASQFVVPDLTPHVKGAWVELSPALPRGSRSAMIFVGQGNPSATIVNSQLIDIATGAASSEVTIIPNLTEYRAASGGSTSAASAYPRNFAPLALPAGVRISARNQSSVADGLSSATCSVILYLA